MVKVKVEYEKRIERVCVHDWQVNTRLHAFIGRNLGNNIYITAIFSQCDKCDDVKAEESYLYGAEQEALRHSTEISLEVLRAYARRISSSDKLRQKEVLETINAIKTIEGAKDGRY